MCLRKSRGCVRVFTIIVYPARGTLRAPTKTSSQHPAVGETIVIARWRGGKRIDFSLDRVLVND